MIYGVSILIDIYDVIISAKALKCLNKIPKHLVIKLQAWIDGVAVCGLREVMKTPGYHDEPLKGKRRGQRSIRLSRGYRAVYHILDDGKIEFIEVLEVNNHEY